MNRCQWLTVLVCALLAVPACQGDPPLGIGDAAPLIADYEEALGQLDEIVTALNIGSTPPEMLLRVPEEDDIPTTALADLRRIGKRIARVSISVTSGRSDPQVVTLALATATARVRRNLAGAAGAAIEGRRAILPPPNPIVVNIENSDAGLRKRAKAADLDNFPKEDRLGLAGVQLKQDYEVDLLGLIYLALLANPQARAALAPNLSPDAIPIVTPELAEERNLPVASREEWQNALFDDTGRLVLPTSEESIPYTVLREWSELVNVGLGAQAIGLLYIALDAEVAESRRLTTDTSA